MSLVRFAPLFLAGTLLVGVGACSAAREDDFGDPDGAESGARLENEGPDEIGILPNGTTQLSVRYLDESGDPLDGVPVEFALADPAAGSSLTPATPVTDQNGRARTLLRVGSELKEDGFKVRVSAEGVEPIFIRIEVGTVATVSLSVKVVYEGARDIASYTVTRVASSGCEDALALGLAGDPTYSYQDRDETQLFELGPGLHYALVAWGRDVTNARVATGCAELDAPITSDDESAKSELSVELRDLPMELDGSYDLTLDLDVSRSVERLASWLVEAVRTGLPQSPSPEGDAYLNALEAELRARDESEALAALLSLREGSLASELSATLSSESTGLVAQAELLAEALRVNGSRLELRSTYGYAAELPSMLVVNMTRARSADGLVNLDFAPSQIPQPAATIDAAYSDTFAALSIATLSIELGLGSYGMALIAALAEQPALGTSSHAGCASLSALVADEPELAAGCDGTCVEAACGRALATSRAPALSAMSGLDVSHPNIGLRGRVYAHDRDEDGLVDDLGPAELEGNWGRADDADAPDRVDGKVPLPSPNKYAP